ncbi:MAG: hypothetical protein AAFQ83_04800 [Bacteroidota bacterium]
MNEQDYDLIERYFLGALSVKEKELVETRVKEDEAFAQAFQLQKQLVQVVDAQMEADFKAQLQEVEQRMNSSENGAPSSQARSIPRWLYAVAAALLVLLIGYWLLPLTSPETTPTNQALFADHFQPYRNLVVPIQRSQDSLSTLESAFLSYEKQEYAQAAAQMTMLYQADSSQTALLFYGGISYLAFDQPDDAIFLLQAYLLEKNEFQDEAKWYLAWAFLLKDKNTQARELWGEVAESATDQNLRKQAEEVLSEMD